MPSSPAQRGHRRVAVRHRGLGQPHLSFRQRELPAALGPRARAALSPATRGGRPRSWCRSAPRRRRAPAGPSRSSFQTTSRSPFRSDRRQSLLSPGRSSRTPEVRSWLRLAAVVAARGPQGVALQVQRLGSRRSSRRWRSRSACVANGRLRHGGRSAEMPVAPLAGGDAHAQITMRSISSTVTVSAVRS